MLFVAAVYRGCTDGFTDVPSLEYSYVGCRNQTWNNRSLRWCICNTTLCNGESLEAIARRRSPTSFAARLLLTPPPLPPYRRPHAGAAAARQVPARTRIDEHERERASVASDYAKAGFYQSWNAEPVLHHGGPYLWNPNNKPPRMYLSTTDTDN